MRGGRVQGESRKGESVNAHGSSGIYEGLSLRYLSACNLLLQCDETISARVRAPLFHCEARFARSSSAGVEHTVMHRTPMWITSHFDSLHDTNCYLMIRGDVPIYASEV